MKRLLLLSGLLAVPAMALFAAVLTLAMAFALQGDVEALAKQLRSQGKVAKSLQVSVEEVRNDLAASQAAAAPAVVSEAPPAMAAVSVPAQVVQARLGAAGHPGRVVRAKAAAPRECVFKPGAPDALMDCLLSR